MKHGDDSFKLNFVPKKSGQNLASTRNIEESGVNPDHLNIPDEKSGFKNSTNSFKKENPTPSNISNTVAIYTTISILFDMKNRLGLEAMLEYMEKYHSIIGKSNPDFNTAVRRALEIMSVEKMYKDAVEYDKH